MAFLINSFFLATTALSFFYASHDGNNTDLSDVGSIASAGTITIPSAWNGRVVRQSIGSDRSATAYTANGNKGGAGYDGMPKASMSTGAGSRDGGTAYGAPVVVATGNTFTGTNLGTANGSWQCVELFPSTLKYALVNRITSSFSVGTTDTMVDWNNEVADTDGFHDNATNPSRLTVPSGVTRVRITANIEVASAGGQLAVTIYKNGSTTGYIFDNKGEFVNICSPPLTVTSGDYFQIAVACTTATSVSVSNASWACIEVMDPALNVLSSTSSTTTMSPGITNEQVIGSQTVPAGVTRIRAGALGQRERTSGSALLKIQKNSADFAGMGTSMANTTGTDYAYAMTGILEVTPGDVIRFTCATDAGATNWGSTTYWIEEVAAVTS